MTTRRFYTLGEKRSILKRQRDESLTDSELARLYDLTPIQVARWRTNLQKIVDKKASLKTLHAGRPSKYAESENDLLLFVEQRRRAKRGRSSLANTSRFC
jgi:hypothetical protein